MIERERIVVEYVYPPIPDRQFDYAATRGDYDLGARVGWGPTELAAINDLLELEDEDE